MSEALDEVIVVGGASAPEKSQRRMGTDALSALNICFLVTTVVGAVSEYFGIVYLAVGVMIVFLAFGFVFRKEVPNIERFGDSAYYQGFILTLFALLFALTGKGSHEITSDAIIQKFGLAIWTTCIGMTGRIFVIQFLATVSDQDEEARESISEYIAGVHKEMESTLAEFRNFRATIADTISKITHDLSQESKKDRKDATDAVKSAMSTLLRSVGQSTDQLDRSVKAVADRIAHLDIPTDVLADRIHKIADALEGDLNALRVGLEQGANRFANTLNGSVSVLERTRSDLDVLQKALADVNRLLLSASKETSESLSTTKENLAASAQAARGVEQLGETASRLANRLAQLDTVFDKRARSYGDQFENASREMAAIVTRAEEEANSVSDAVVESAKKITSALREVGRVDE